MPTYEYACKDCGQHIEVVQSMSDAPLTACGACGGMLRKVFHPAGIMFKGSGFYATDSRKKGTPAAAKNLKDMSASDIKAEGAKAAGVASDGATGKDAGAGKDTSSGGGATSSGDSSPGNSPSRPSKRKEKSA